MDTLPPELIDMILGYLTIEEIGICLDAHCIFNVINSDTKYKVRLAREPLFVATFSKHSRHGDIRIVSNIHTTLKNAIKDIIRLVVDNCMIKCNWEDCQESSMYYRGEGGYRQFLYECTQPPTLESSVVWMAERIDMTNVDAAVKSLSREFKNIDRDPYQEWSMNIVKTTINV